MVEKNAESTPRIAQKRVGASGRVQRRFGAGEHPNPTAKIGSNMAGEFTENHIPLVLTTTARSGPKWLANNPKTHIGRSFHRPFASLVVVFFGGRPKRFGGLLKGNQK